MPGVLPCPPRPGGRKARNSPAGSSTPPRAGDLDALLTMLAPDVVFLGDGTVQAIRSVVNPDKLGHLGPVSDVARIPGRE